LNATPISPHREVVNSREYGIQLTAPTKGYKFIEKLSPIIFFELESASKI